MFNTKLEVIFRCINNKGICIQEEHFLAAPPYDVRDKFIQYYLQQRTVRDFCRLTIDIAFPED